VNGDGGPREKKILARNGANYCEMVQIGARLHWLTVKLAILIFDWEEEACLTLIHTNFHEFWSRIFVVCGPWRSNEAAGFLHGS
jgi:hypothetical protein